MFYLRLGHSFGGGSCPPGDFEKVSTKPQPNLRAREFYCRFAVRAPARKSFNQPTGNKKGQIKKLILNEGNISLFSFNPCPGGYNGNLPYDLPAVPWGARKSFNQPTKHKECNIRTEVERQDKFSISFFVQPKDGNLAIKFACPYAWPLLLYN